LGTIGLAELELTLVLMDQRILFVWPELTDFYGFHIHIP
jgi:hypothetical protein